MSMNLQVEVKVKTHVTVVECRQLTRQSARVTQEVLQSWASDSTLFPY